MPFLAEEGQEISLVLDWWHADERLARRPSDTPMNCSASWTNFEKADGPLRLVGEPQQGLELIVAGGPSKVVGDLSVDPEAQQVF